MRQASTGATRDDKSGKPDYSGYLSAVVLWRFSQYMMKHQIQADGKPRGAGNWKRGMPRAWYVESLFRHFMSVFLWWETGDCGCDERGNPIDLEEALCGVFFNAAGLLLEILLGRDIDECTTEG